jgi:hypothetical protein
VAGWHGIAGTGGARGEDTGSRCVVPFGKFRETTHTFNALQVWAARPASRAARNWKTACSMSPDKRESNAVVGTGGRLAGARGAATTPDHRGADCLPLDRLPMFARSKSAAILRLAGQPRATVLTAHDPLVATAFLI